MILSPYAWSNVLKILEIIYCPLGAKNRTMSLITVAHVMMECPARRRELELRLISKQKMSIVLYFNLFSLEAMKRPLSLDFLSGCCMQIRTSGRSVAHVESPIRIWYLKHLVVGKKLVVCCFRVFFFDLNVSLRKCFLISYLLWVYRGLFAWYNCLPVLSINYCLFNRKRLSGDVD